MFECVKDLKISSANQTNLFVDEKSLITNGHKMIKRFLMVSQLWPFNAGSFVKAGECETKAEFSLRLISWKMYQFSTKKP